MRCVQRRKARILGEGGLGLELEVGGIDETENHKDKTTRFEEADT